MSSQQSWGGLRDEIVERDGGKCRFCGITNEAHQEQCGRELEVHHVIPRKHGGSDEPHNLVTLCRSCHRTLETIHADAVAEVLHKQKHRRTLEGLNYVYDLHRDKARELEERLEEFIDDHPIFRDHFGFFDENERGTTPTVKSYDVELRRQDGQITSEWEFLMLYGYKVGLREVVGTLDGETDVPIDDL